MLYTKAICQRARNSNYIAYFGLLQKLIDLKSKINVNSVKNGKIKQNKQKNNNNNM